jgi:hypothetical protein
MPYLEIRGGGEDSFRVGESPIATFLLRYFKAEVDHTKISDRK